MNKLFKTISIIFITIFLFAGNSFAWSIDITPAYGDQDASDIIANIGDTVMYQLWFNPDPEVGTLIQTAYTWRLDHDEDELEFDLDSSTQYDMGAPYQWYMSALKEDPAGFTTAGAMTFSPGTRLFEPMLLADLAYTVVAPVDDDLSDLFYDNTVVPQEDGFYIYDDEIEEKVFHNCEDIVAYHNLTSGANVAPVPIPGAVWLLGSGLIGLIGLRRKS